MGPLGVVFRGAKLGYRGLAKKYGSEEMKLKIAQAEERERRQATVNLILYLCFIGVIVGFLVYLFTS